MGSTERKPAHPAAERNEADRAADALWRQLETRGLLRPGSTRERAS